MCVWCTQNTQQGFFHYQVLGLEKHKALGKTESKKVKLTERSLTFWFTVPLQLQPKVAKTLYSAPVKIQRKQGMKENIMVSTVTDVARQILQNKYSVTVTNTPWLTPIRNNLLSPGLACTVSYPNLGTDGKDTQRRSKKAETWKF